MTKRGAARIVAQAIGSRHTELPASRALPSAPARWSTASASRSATRPLS